MALNNGSREPNTSAPEIIRVFAADDQAAVRDILSDVVDTESSLHLVGLAEDAPSAVGRVGELLPDVVVLDVKIPGGGGQWAAREMKLVSPGTRIVAYSAYEDEQTQQEMRSAGAATYVVKGGPLEELLNAIFAL